MDVSKKNIIDKILESVISYDAARNAILKYELKDLKNNASGLFGTLFSEKSTELPKNIGGRILPQYSANKEIIKYDVVEEITKEDIAKHLSFIFEKNTKIENISLKIKQ